MGTGSDAAIEASDLTLVRGDLLAVPDAILLSRRALATIKGNLIWAFGYNAAAIPLAALGFLNPLIAAAAMAFSSVFVVTNSLRLRRFRPGSGPATPPPDQVGRGMILGCTDVTAALPGRRPAGCEALVVFVLVDLAAGEPPGGSRSGSGAGGPAGSRPCGASRRV